MSKTKKTKTETKAPSFRQWDLYVDGINATGLRLFRACREQFRLRFLEGWVPTSFRRVEFGTLVHKILEFPHEDPYVIAAAYEEKRMKEVPPTDRDSLSLVCLQAAIMAKCYRKYWEGNDKFIKWRVRELDISDTIFPAQNGLHYLRPIRIRGRIDGVIQEKKRVRVHEIKTRSQIDEEGITGLLPFDLQVMLYSYALKKIDGQEPVGVLYDVIRRPSIVPHKGRGKKAVPETMKEYRLRLREDVLATRPNWYFMRFNVDFAKGDIDRFVQQQLSPLMKDLCIWYDDLRKHGTNPWGSPVHYLNDEALYGRFGRCELFDAITRNRFTGLKQEHPLSHLEDAE